MTDIFILAAGNGKRMRSKDPKVLYKILGKPIIHYLLDSVVAANICENPTIVVSNSNKDCIKKSVKKYNCKFAIQEEQLGTGHALARALVNNIDLTDNILVALGDDIGLSSKTIKRLNEKHQSSGCPITMATTKMPHYNGIYKRFYDYGRIKRNSNNEIVAIVEKLDANEKELEIKEVNPSFYAFQTDWIKKNINKIQKNKIKGEYYLTDIVAIAIEQGLKVNSIKIQPEECFGINTPEQARQGEKYRRTKQEKTKKCLKRT